VLGDLRGLTGNVDLKVGMKYQKNCLGSTKTPTKNWC